MTYISNGFELRFKYNNTKLATSNMETNATTNAVNEYFKFESEFAGTEEKPILDIFKVPEKDPTDKLPTDTIIRLATAFYPPVEESQHIIKLKDEDNTAGSTGGTTEGDKIITTKEEGGVLLGKMSFKMLTNETFNKDDFGLALVPSSHTPQTGIKINVNAAISYESPAEKIFIFTNNVVSKDADLTNIVLSSGKIDEENPDQSTYKEYNLTPSFDKETKNYELNLLEDLDTIDITATQSNEFATMKIKTPKRDENGNLMYEEDGTTIIYEEKDLTNEEATAVTLNKLGEPETIITIHVTAEDTSIENEYQITIKRPYGIIKGSICTPETTEKGTYNSNIRIYKSEDVAKVIDWKQVENGKMDDVHDKLIALDSGNYKTNDDGTYEIYVVPGKYDVLIDKPGYLDHIYTDTVVEENEKVDLGYKELVAGDLNKDGIVNVVDLSLFMTDYSEIREIE